MSRLSSWLQTHRTEALIGAGGAVAVYALYRSKHGTAAGSPVGGILGTSSSVAPTSTISGAYGPYDSSQLDQYNQLAGAISSANDQINAIQTQLASNAVAQIPPAAGSGLTPLSGEALAGSGYTAPSGAVTTSGGSYDWLSSMNQVNAIEQAGGSVYFQPSPGYFLPAPTNLSGLAPTTPLYSKVS